MQNIGNFELFRSWWKANKSSIKGYHKNYKAQTKEGVILQADYNFHEELVKLTIEEEFEDGSNEPISVIIKKGNTIREKNGFFAKRGIKDKFAKYKEIFSCIPDDDLLKSLRNIYGISEYSLGRRKVDKTLDSSGEYSTKDEFPNESFFERLLRRNKNYSFNYLTYIKYLKNRFWGDLHDALLGVTVGLSFYYHFFDFMILGLVIGCMGIIVGGLDWKIRERNPMFLKQIAFFAMSTYFLYTGYTQY